MLFIINLHVLRLNQGKTEKRDRQTQITNAFNNYSITKYKACLNLNKPLALLEHKPLIPLLRIISLWVFKGNFFKIKNNNHPPPRLRSSFTCRHRCIVIISIADILHFSCIYRYTLPFCSSSYILLLLH